MTTTTVNAADAKEEFPELISRVAHNKDRIVITRRGKDVAAIVPLEDLALILASQNKDDLREATEALKEARGHGTAALDDFKEELG